MDQITVRVVEGDHTITEDFISSDEPATVIVADEAEVVIVVPKGTSPKLVLQPPKGG
jgi:hypothetical protein